AVEGGDGRESPTGGPRCGRRKAVLQPDRYRRARRGLRARAAETWPERLVPPADRPGKRGSPSPRRGTIEQGSGDAARSGRVDGRNPSGQSHAEAESSQYGRDRSVRRSEGTHLLTAGFSPIDRMVPQSPLDV